MSLQNQEMAEAMLQFTIVSTQREVIPITLHGQKKARLNMLKCLHSLLQQTPLRMEIETTRERIPEGILNQVTTVIMGIVMALAMVRSTLIIAILTGLDKRQVI